MKKKILFLILLMVLCVFPFVKVNAEEDPLIHVYGNTGGTYTFTIVDSHGTVPGDNYPGYINFSVEYNAEVTLTATPSEGYGFVGWFGVKQENDTWVIDTNHVYSGLPSFTFNATEAEYRFAPLFELQASCSGAVGHNNIWVTAGGKESVIYEPMGKDGTNFVGGEEVNYCVGDEITVKAIADEGYHFVGWFISDPLASVPENYVREPVLSTNSTYTYKPGVTTVSGYDDPINYITAVFEEDDSAHNKKTYTLDDDRGNQIIFVDYEGIVYVFNSTDILNITDEELAQIAADMEKSVEEVRAMGEAAIEAATNGVKGKGTLVGLFDFSVFDGNVFKEQADGGFKIRIKMNDEMKKYNDFSIAFVKEDGTLDELIKLTANGDYLEGTLPHLSTYAIIGNVVDKSSNPKTGDNILLYISMLGLSVIGFGIYKKKRIN